MTELVGIARFKFNEGKLDEIQSACPHRRWADAFAAHDWTEGCAAAACLLDLYDPPR